MNKVVESNSNNLQADLQFLMDFAEKNHEQYIKAEPFPHIVIDNFIRPEILEAVLAEFLHSDPTMWMEMTDKYQKKFATNKPSELGEQTRNLIHFLNSREIVNFIEVLTGINGLIPDPHLAGGGLHELRRGGFLNVHADFNWHNKLRLDRRLNLLLYLNKDWLPEYGGNLELWDKKMEHCVKEYEPVFNRCVIFSTTDTSYHGNPNPVNCPENRSRRSIALYYYSNGRPEEEVSIPHETLFQNRPGETTAGEAAKSMVKKLIPPLFIDLYQSSKKTK